MRDKSQANYAIKHIKIEQKWKKKGRLVAFENLTTSQCVDQEFLCWPDLNLGDSTSICPNQNEHVVFLVMWRDTFQLEMRFTSFWHLTVKRVKEQSFL